MEVWAFVLSAIICGLAWHRRRLMGEVMTLRRQVWALQNAQQAPEHRVYFAPYDAPAGQERWVRDQNDSTLTGEYTASQRLYNVFGRGYLN